jgi:glycosyltransferase involved in cell wall biosynthesis
MGVAIYKKYMVITFSALIVCYKRREYILEAVKSVLNQNFPRDSFEIVVVKGFSDESIEKELESYHVKTIFCDSPSYGLSVSTGIDNCKNEIICLLDDDDLFTANKFQKLSVIFEDNPEVELVVNDYYRIDKIGNEINVSNHLSISGKEEVNVLDLKKLNFNTKIAREFDIFFNTSRLSFRNRNSDKLSEYVRKVSYGVDNAIVMFYLFAPLKIILTQSCLTGYRIHEKNISRIENYSNSLGDMKQILYKEIESLRNIEINLVDADQKFLYHLEFFKLFLSLKIAYTTHNRKSIFQETINILKFYLSYRKKMHNYGFYPKLKLYVYRDVVSLPIFLLMPVRMSRLRLTRFY